MICSKRSRSIKTVEIHYVSDVLVYTKIHAQKPRSTRSLIRFRFQISNHTSFHKSLIQERTAIKAEPKRSAIIPRPDLEMGWFVTAALPVEVEVPVLLVLVPVEVDLVPVAVAVAFWAALQKTSLKFPLLLVMQFWSFLMS